MTSLEYMLMLTKTLFCVTYSTYAAVTQKFYFMELSKKTMSHTSAAAVTLN